MRLDTKLLMTYVGGQLEVQNRNQKYLYRAEIANASVEKNELRIKFAWAGRLEGFPIQTGRWIKDDRPSYVANLRNYSVSDLGQGRICLNSSNGETTVIFPKNGNKLDPSRIEGLAVKTHTFAPTKPVLDIPKRPLPPRLG